MILRIFHSIGQGGFTSERHGTFTAVYDCGSLPDSKSSQSLVEQSFEEGSIINILFISHFDDDHVNKISILVNKCRIDNVVMPLLHQEDKLILVNFFKALGHIDSSAIIEDPQTFFGNNTKIIFVEPTENEKDNLDAEVVTIEELSTKSRIKSSTKILSHLLKWMYIPFNYEYKTRSQQLIDLFSIHDIDIDSLKINLTYALANKTKLNKIYKIVKNGINENSMLVYSGPFEGDYFLLERFIGSRVGCIYSGDINFNRFNIRTIFGTQWDQVGTVQVPHHGDRKCFNSSFFDGRVYICPILYGTKNSYGHPSMFVQESIIINYSFPVLVNEFNHYLQVIKKGDEF